MCVGDPTETYPAQLSGHSVSGVATIDELSSTIQAAIDKAEEAVNIFASVGAETSQNRAEAIKVQLEEARQASDALRDGGLLVGGSVEPEAAAPPKTTFNAKRPDRDKVAEVRPHVGKPHAFATLWDGQGRKVVGVHSADNDGPARQAPWCEPWGSYAKLRRHIEGHAAARMHRDGHREMALYINMSPCSYDDGCNANLEQILPRGTTLWVHVLNKNGWTTRKRYDGTGESYEEER